MPYTKYLTGYFQNDPQSYASEILRKEATGGQFTDQAAAQAFKKAYPDLFKTQKAAQQPTPVQSQAPTPQPAQPQIQQPQNITQEFTPQVQDLLSQIKSYISRPPQTPDQMLQSDYGQQLTGAVDTLRDQQMRQARAQLAAAGGLYPDDTRAAERFGQVGAEAARMQAGQILPALLAAAQGQRSAGLNELLAGLGAQTGEEAAALNRILSTFGTVAPYQYLTEYQRQTLPLQWAEAVGQVPGGSIPGGGGTVPARQYVEQRGGSITWSRSPSGGNIVNINGRVIDVEAVGGQNIDGRIYLPQWIIDQALGVA